MLRLRISRIELLLQFDRERIVAAIADTGQRIPETVGDAPGMATLADDDALDAKLQRGVPDPHGNLAHRFVVAVEQAEVARFCRMRGQGPVDARRVEYLGIADQRFNMRLGEEVGS